MRFDRCVVLAVLAGLALSACQPPGPQQGEIAEAEPEPAATATDVAAPIFYASVRGDYVVTPSHLRLEEPLEFVGREPESFERRGLLRPRARG